MTGSALEVDACALNVVFNALRRVLGVLRHLAVLSLILVVCLLPLVLSLHRHVTSALMLHSTEMRLHVCNSHPHNSHACVHDARCAVNSQNPEGDSAGRGRGNCVPAGTKASSTNTLSQVGCPASLQQASGKVRGETWAGRNESLSLEIFPGSGNRTWGVRLLCPRPFFAPVLPGPGREVRSVLVWTSVQTTERSGVWWFRGAFKGQNVFLPFLQRENGAKKGSYHTAWAVPSTFFVFLLICSWAGPSCRATHWGCGAGHCFLGCGGLSHP